MREYFARQIEGSFYQYATYLFGCFFFSIGAKFFIDSHLGTDPLDVLCIGMTKHLPITIGIASGIVAFLFLACWSLLNRKAPPLTPFFTTFSVGLLIDFWGYIELQRYTGALNHYVLLLFAVLICAYSSSLIIMSGIGIRIMDLVAITLIEKLNWSFFRAKMFLEILLFGTGWMLGGPVGIGTLAFLIGVGPFIQPFMAMNESRLKMNNYGVKKNQVSSEQAA